MSRLWKLLPLEEARKLAESASFEEPPRERVPVAYAMWRIAAEDVVAERDVPDRPLAAMDGFAVRSEDLARGVKPRLAGKVERGSEPPEMRPGEAYEVETGAPMPLGADAVVRREASRVVGGLLETAERAWPGKDVFRPGEFVAKGEVLAGRGEVLTPYKVSLLLQAGVDEVEIYRVRATVILAGDAARPETPSKAAAYRDNITPIIAGLMPWAEIRVVGPLPPGPEPLEEALKLAARTSDVIVTIGRASVGGGDDVKEVVAKIGDVIVPGVAVSVVKRGGLGRVHGRLVSILPGQCVSAATAAHEMMLRAMRGVTGRSLVREETARLAEDLAVERRMDTLYLVSLRGGEARPLKWGVGLCRELARADGYVVLKRGAHRRGEEVSVVLLSGARP